MQMNITTRVYVGFGIVLALALVAIGVGVYSLTKTSDVFVQYRTLARQTNADGRVQANMLMTRIFAKNFVIEANPENIEGVKARAESTLRMIDESRGLTSGSSARQLLISDLRDDLETYVSEFEKVTEWQARRDELVINHLNVLGPRTEQALTEIMTSALDDGDAIAAYEAGVTLRSLMLGRLYANRFLIQNDDASVDRAMREFRDMELNVERLLSELENPTRRQLAETVKELQDKYMEAFVAVRRVIGERNILIRHQLDRIGPEVADRIERLKLAIKDQQDTLGPQAQASIIQAEIITLVASAIAIVAGFLVAGIIGRGVARPVRALTDAAEAIAQGDFQQKVDTSRSDEIGTLARAFVSMREAIDEKVSSLRDEIAERTKAERAREAAQDELRRTNERLEEQVRERTAELARREDELRVALASMSDGLFTIDADLKFRMFNDQYVALTGLPDDLIQEGRALETILRLAAEQGFYGEGEPAELANSRLSALASTGFIQNEVRTKGGRILDLRKNDIPSGGAVVVVSDVTERKQAEEALSEAFSNISGSIKYASRIQHAVLPTVDFMNQQLGDHFVHWEPRDVVGGDIYWCRPWGDGLLLLLGDCTGHGVPGAFMTLISTGALERAMAETAPRDVSKVVSRMHGLIQAALGLDGRGGANGSDSDSNGSDDGLELGACYIEHDAKRLTFVGAHFDLYMVNDGAVEVVRGGRKGLGYREIPADQDYPASTIDVSVPTRFYMATDGMVDQIGPGMKRFGKKRFSELLVSLQDRPVREQGQAIHDTLLAHQGDAPRLDDVAVIGFTLG